MRNSLTGLTRRVHRLVGGEKSKRCANYLILLNRADFVTEADFQRAVQAEIAAHRCPTPGTLRTKATVLAPAEDSTH